VRSKIIKTLATQEAAAASHGAQRQTPAQKSPKGGAKKWASTLHVARVTGQEIALKKHEEEKRQEQGGRIPASEGSRLERSERGRNS